MYNLKIKKIFISDDKKTVIAMTAARINFDLRAGCVRQVLKNRREFFAKLGLQLSNAVFFEQVHSSGVLIANNSHGGKGSSCYNDSIIATDAAVTDTDDLALCILTADCLNIFFYHEASRAVGIAHAGWKGTLKSIAPKTANKLLHAFGGDIKRLKVYIGPGIKKCCCEVGPEFKKKFPHAVTKNKNKFYLDLISENIRQLKCIGIKRENIKDISVCTSCNNKAYFSYRKGDLKERNLSVIVKKI